MLAEYPKIFVAHDVAILKWDIPYHLPCVSVLMWQIKIGIFQFIFHTHKKKKPCFLMWQSFLVYTRSIPFFLYTCAIILAD